MLWILFIPRSYALRLLVLAALTACSIKGSGQTEKFIQLISGPISSGDTCTVTDDKFIDPIQWQHIEKLVDVANVVSFEMRFDTSLNYFLKAFSCTIQLDIEYLKADHSTASIKNVLLTVNYDTASGGLYKPVTWYKFNGGHQVKLTVKKITSPQFGNKIPPVFRLKNELFIDRLYLLPNNAITAVSSTAAAIRKQNRQVTDAAPLREASDNIGQQVTVNWEVPDPPYPEYDFEWTYYPENSSTGKALRDGTFSFLPSDLASVFHRNSSRVTVRLPQYQLNLVYQAGWVFHRVRGARYDEVSGERTEGPWSYLGSYTVNNSGYGVIRVLPHEENMNWQYARLFAEQGKQHESVQYFDGSLRLRQEATLRNDNSSSSTIVEETIPDASGRPALHVLPAPTTEATLHFFHAFNRSAASGKPYYFRDFDLPGGCAAKPGAMANGSGASNYYSASNPALNADPKKERISRYLPDAAGFPFAVSSYTPDNTGRYSARHGVGEQFQPGSSVPQEDHGTRYFYGKPQQYELDRLFGNEAGNAAHYSKLLTTDPNGQSAVTYFNMAGQTIATGITGERPGRLLQLPTYKENTSPVKIDLIADDNIVRDPAALTITCNSNYLAASAGNAVLKYSFTPVSLQVLYGIENAKICASCYYDMSITVSDACGNTVGVVQKDAVFNEETGCAIAPAAVEGEFPVQFPSPGSYHVRLVLGLSRKAVDYYSSHYLLQDTSLKTETGFEKDFLHRADLAGCYSNCATCLADLGSEEQFRSGITVMLQSDYGLTPSASDTVWITQLYHRLLDSCTAMQQGCGNTGIPCEETTLLMIEDLTPGGQYMRYDENLLVFTERDVNAYLNNRDALTMPVTINNVTRPFNQWEESTLISHWQEEWSHWLLPYHPENPANCLLENCLQQAQGEQFGQQMLNTESVQSAARAHYWYGDNYPATVAHDPYFADGARGAADKARFLSGLTDFRGTGLDIMSFIRWKIYCSQGDSLSDLPIQLVACPRTNDCNRDQEEWELFRVLYFSLRQDFITKNNCAALPIFADPLATLPGFPGNSTGPPPCPGTGLFDRVTDSSGPKIRYNGAEKTGAAARIHYIAVDSLHELIPGGAGFLDIPSGTLPGAAFPLKVLAGPEYIIDYCRCDPAHPYAGKTPRNPNAASLAAAVNNIRHSSPAGLNQYADSVLRQDCIESCSLYADGWMQKLAACSLRETDSLYASLRQGLLAVCNNSCSSHVQDHPFGAPEMPTPDSLGDRNFRDVFLRVLGARQMSASCNDLLLDFPPAQQHALVTAPAFTRRLEPCAYQVLVSWKKQFALNGTAGLFSDFIKTYIDKNFFLADEDIKQLMTAFENNCFTPLPILLPASLNCSQSQPITCLNCDILEREKENFFIEYFYIDSTDALFPAAFTAYINRTYGFGLAPDDLTAALTRCHQLPDNAAFPESCESLSLACKHFVSLRPSYHYLPRDANEKIWSAQLTTWLNLELGLQLDQAGYRVAAEKCGFNLPLPVNTIQPACDSALPNPVLPRVLTCCEPITEIEHFRALFPDSVNARLLAYYFNMLKEQQDAALNLPAAGFTWAYDSIVQYFQRYHIAQAYQVLVTPDSLLGLQADSTQFCQALAVNFRHEPSPHSGNAAFVICNHAVFPLLATDSNSCLHQQFNTAIAEGKRSYLTYLEQVKRDYREAYYLKCMSIHPSLTLENNSTAAEDHFTLYYYDQAGNLIKTIPPAGVRWVNAGDSGELRMARVKNSRLANRADCYEYADAPLFNGTATISVAGNAVPRQDTHPFTLETFISFSDLVSDQVIADRMSANSGDGRLDGFRVYLAGGRLRVDYAGHGRENWIQRISREINYPWPDPYTGLPPVKIRTIVPISVPRKVYRSFTTEINTPLKRLVAPGEWIHLAIAFTGSRDEPVKLYVNGSTATLSPLSSIEQFFPENAPSLSPEDVAAGAFPLDFQFGSVIDSLSVSNTNDADLQLGATINGFRGRLKQVRLYNRTLNNPELRKNAFDQCAMPSATGALVLWLPLSREETTGVSADQYRQLFTVNRNTVFSDEYQPVYPAHFLPTIYEYDSREAVTRQFTPDGGEVTFYHDRSGRLFAAQNAEQKKSTRGEPDNRYSYNLYDPVGRLVETGEKSGALALSNEVLDADPSAESTALSRWLLSGKNTQVIQTIYDTAAPSIVTDTSITSRQRQYTTSRKRIVSTLYRDNPESAAGYNNATHYQYDISGNIKTLWQENKYSVTGQAVNLLKEIKYAYDLVSGKVNTILYQDKKGDQFRYAFTYDPGNRLLGAFSGRQANMLQQDAAYQYYQHGPLARLELGDAPSNRIVQGIDYVYNLQGWLKGINGVLLPSASLTPATTDAGADGMPLSSGAYHAQVAADRLSFSLGYFTGDYTPIGGSTAGAFKAEYQSPGSGQPAGNDLFNGNIRSAAYSISGIGNGLARGYTYGYDQLDRLRELRAHDLGTLMPGGGWNNSALVPDNRESFGYDGNGNIVSLLRNGTTAGGRALNMDNQVFNYYYSTPGNTRKTYQPNLPIPPDAWSLTNQLAHISDAVPAGNYPGSKFPGEKDIDNQPAGNYGYDGNGNLVRDNAEGISKIGWTAYGKIRRIDKTDGTVIIYDYDPAGNRVMSQVTSGGKKTFTNYIRDVIGNTLAVYTWQGKALVKALPVPVPGNGLAGQYWSEQTLYGLSRLGVWKPGLVVPPSYSDSTGEIIAGSKSYELQNHLGNVMAVISDKKIAVSLPGKPGITDHYEADLLSSSDYTAFGMPMAGRIFAGNAPAYRYGFNGKENDDAAEGPGRQQDYGMRIYDPRVGRFLSTDPLSKTYPGLTPYQFASDRPIEGIDLDGLEFFKKDNTNYILPYRTVFNAPNFKTAIQNAVVNAGNFVSNSTVGPVMETARAINNYFAEGYKHESESSPVQQFVDFTNNQFRYITTTSGRQQLQDLAATASNLKTYELPFQLLIAHKLSFSEPELKYHVDWENYDNFLEGKFAQRSHSNVFSDDGQSKLGIRTIDQAIEKLTTGVWTPKNLPIDFVVRDGQVYFINTRSSVSLLRSNIDRSEWVFRNRTGVKLFERNLTENLKRTNGFKEVINRQTKVVTKMK